MKKIHGLLVLALALCLVLSACAGTASSVPQSGSAIPATSVPAQEETTTPLRLEANDWLSPDTVEQALA